MIELLAQGGFLSDVTALVTAIAGLIGTIVAGWKFLDERRKRREAEAQQRVAEQREHAAEKREKEAEARNTVLEEAIATLQASIADLQAPSPIEEDQVDPKLAQQLVAAVNSLTSAVKQLQGDVGVLKKQNEVINERLDSLASDAADGPSEFEAIDDGSIDDFSDPFPGPMGQPVGMEEAKRAYLVGQEPKAKKVHLLVKVHDYRGKAIYLYNLRTGQLVQEANSESPDIDTRIARYRQVGHKITHPGTIPFKDARRWCDHARAEARRLGLVIG